MMAPSGFYVFCDMQIQFVVYIIDVFLKVFQGVIQHAHH